MNKTFLKFLLFSLSLIALILFFIILYKITISSTSDVNNLLVPLGVLISAGLASVSVMNSIANANEIELKKNKKEHDKNITYFTLSLANTFRQVREIREILRSFLDKDNYVIEDFKIFEKNILKLKKEFEIKQDKSVISDIDFKILEKYHILTNIFEYDFILKVQENIEKNIECSILSEEFKNFVNTIQTVLSKINEVIILMSERYLEEIPSIKIMFNESYSYYEGLTTKKLNNSDKET